jgi:hypothetical protein
MRSEYGRLGCEGEGNQDVVVERRLGKLRKAKKTVLKGPFVAKPVITEVGSSDSWQS